MADSGGEKSELPTPKKRTDARDEGQVAFSPEVNTTGMLLVGFSALAFFAPWFWSMMGATLRRALTDDLQRELVDGHEVIALFVSYAPVGIWLTPMFGALIVAALVLNLAQVGWHPTLKPLMPKLERLNPLTGLQRLFSLRGFMRFLTNAVKLGLIIFFAWKLLVVAIPHAVLAGPEIAARFAQECRNLWSIAMKLSSVLAAVAFSDYIYQRFQQTRDLMMTKQEIKEEYKQSEGNPLVKGKIRQIQRAMAQRRMMQEVPKADVVITNPTHVAVALKYEKGGQEAPIVVAKGYDAIAQQIKKLATEAGVTMVENVQLARSLAKEVEIGKPIPVKWYTSVAEVLAMVYKLKKAG